MYSPTYLLKSRHGVFYFRWPLPKQLRAPGTAATIKISLQTRDPRKALRLSRPLIHMGEQLNEHGLAVRMEYKELRELLTQHFRDLLNKVTNEIDREGRLNEHTRRDYQLRLAATQQEIETDAPLSFGTNYDDLLANFMAQYQVPFTARDEQHDWLRRDFKLAVRSFLRSVLKHDSDYDDFDLTARPSAVTQSPMVQASEQVSLTDLAERFMNEQTSTNVWTERTALEKRDHIGLLKQILGDERDIRTVSQGDVAKVKDTLTSLPRNRTKDARTRGKTLTEMLAIEGLETLQIPTINKYIQTYNDMFGWAKRHSLIETNFFDGTALRYNRNNAKIKRRPFTVENVRTILDAVALEPSMYARKQYQKWGPLLGAYTGARRNEIAQIELRDVRKVDGIWVFDLNDEVDEEDGVDKRFKTEASRRLVPVHKHLIDIGLLAYRDQLLKQGKRRLFPELTNQKNRGYGQNLGRWFNEQLLVKLDIKAPQLVFHSFRHTVVTELLRADVPEPMVKAIVGHKQEGVTQQHYFRQGYTIQQLADAMNKLDYLWAAPRAIVVAQD